jgi:V/A-type H+-transporting ATPase subunit I
MIVPMNKIHLLCLRGDRESALANLRDLGVLHVAPVEMHDTADRSELTQHLARVERAVSFLDGVKPHSEAPGNAKRPLGQAPENSCRPDGRRSQSQAPAADGKTVAERTLAAMDRLAELDKEAEVLRRDRERLLPWGDFNPRQICELRNAGVHVALCLGTAADLDRLPAAATVQVVQQVKDRLWFAVMSPEPLDELALPLASVPTDIRLADIDRRIGEIRTVRAGIDTDLAALQPALPLLRDHLAALASELEFRQCRDGMAEHGPVLALTGFVPVPDADRLRAAARQHDWGLLLQKPGPDDQPPTKIVMPKIFRIVEPLFSFMGLAPGYREWDVSVCFLFFFTLFFGMIIGDAGYGAIFLGFTLYLRHRMPGPKMRLPVRLLITLSTVTIIWGLLTGNIFGIPATILPVWLRGVPILTGEVGNRTIKFLCFLIAAGHLSAARGWKALLAFPAKQAFGELGWMLLIWANFFVAVALIVTSGSIATWVLALYAAGILLILTCGVNWRDFGEILSTPFGLIGSFVDVLSYIRLYALGLSTYYIASSFNEMGLMVLDIPFPKFLFPFMVLFMIVVLLLGHALNIAMGVIAVLVHAIRLNTLEFSNHMGLTWSGTSYAPFRSRAANPEGEPLPPPPSTTLSS